MKRKSLARWCATLILPFASSVAFGQQTISLSLSEALERARATDQNILLRQVELERTEWQYQEALGSALPNISAEATAARYLEKPSFGGFSLNSNYETTGSVTVTQALFSFGAISSALKAADVARILGRKSQEATVREIEHAVRVTYSSALLAQDQLRIARQSLKNAEENVNILRRSFGGGRAPQGDLIRLQADLASRRPRVSEAEANYQNTLLSLKRLTGIAIDTEIRLADSPPTEFAALDLNTRVESLRKEQPQLEALRQTVSLQESLADARWSTLMPSLGAFYTYSSSARSEERFLGNDSRINTSVLGLSLRWNLWDGGTTRARYKQALVDQKVAEIQYDKSLRDFELELKQQIQEYDSKRRTLPDAEQAVSLAQQSFRISQNRFRSGKTSVTELNDAEYQLTMAESQKALILFNIQQTLSNIERLSASNPSQSGGSQ